MIEGAPRKGVNIAARQWTHAMTSYSYMWMHLTVGTLLSPAILSLASVVTLTISYWPLNTFQWRYDDICKKEAECFFKVHLDKPISKSSIGFIYLKGFSQADKK